MESLEFFWTPLSAENVKIDRGEILTQEQLNKIKDYKRYQFTKSGISPRSLPGQKGGVYQANSDDHDEYGYSCERSEIRKKIMEKRYAKLTSLAKEMPEPKIYGNKKAEKTVLCWGSTKKTALEALKDLDDARVIHMQYMLPLPGEFFKKNINPQKTIIIEGNQTCQLGLLIKQQTTMDIKNTLLKYDGRPFYPEEIVEAVNKL